MGRVERMALTLTQIDDKQAHCGGCRNNFYNHSGNSSTGHCWSLESAKLRWRWVINMQTPMDKKSRFYRKRVYTCYHGEGPYRDIYLLRLPEHLGGDWADERDKLEHELALAEKKAAHA
jgi:hypothetical protein